MRSATSKSPGGTLYYVLDSSYTVIEVMAAEASLLPDITMGSAQSDMLNDDIFLQDLINNQGVQVRNTKQFY